MNYKIGDRVITCTADRFNKLIGTVIQILPDDKYVVRIEVPEPFMFIEKLGFHSYELKHIQYIDIVEL